MRAPDPTALISSLRGTHPTDTLIKVCGFTTAANAAMAAAAGADMLGLVFAPGSKRLVNPTVARAIGDRIKSMFPREGTDVARLLQPGEPASVDAATWYSRGAACLRAAAAVRPLLFGVFANQPVDEVNAIATAANLDVIQLSGTEGMDGLDAYCRPVVKAVHIADGDAVSDIVAKIHAGRPLAVLFDTKSKSQPSAMGGTGEVFDWKLAADVAATYPFFLAGGLRPDNVVEAVSLVKPFALDVSSGVEASAGVKCVDKVQAFIKAVKSL
eukprot:m.1558751 g.1558751  ORF g.1558751 m.1558751 type:complete len:270 (+) comp25273_c0_seq77:5944-6753(+)